MSAMLRRRLWQIATRTYGYEVNERTAKRRDERNWKQEFTPPTDETPTIEGEKE